MVYTLTWNPSLDYIVTVEGFRMGRVNRTCGERWLTGGKGINVSMVLHNLGVPNTALGFLAGFTGEEIEQRLKLAGCNTDFIRTGEGMSRINLKLRIGEETEINGQGPVIKGEELQMLYGKLDCLCAEDILVLAGSVSGNMQSDSYEKIMERLAPKGLKIIVDAAGDLLAKVLPYHPFLVKPNHHELGAIFDVSPESREEVIPYAKKLQEMGAANVLVSMADKGAVLAAADGRIYQLLAPRGTPVNTVGAGDSMVAGFLAGYLEKREYEYAFLMGLAAGSASAFSEVLAAKEDIKRIFRELREGP